MDVVMEVETILKIYPKMGIVLDGANGYVQKRKEVVSVSRLPIAEAGLEAVAAHRRLLPVNFHQNIVWPSYYFGHPFLRCCC